MPLLYRICLSQYSNALVASGRAGRWNMKGRAVIYASESQSLACLENLAHRTGLGPSGDFKVFVLEVPDDVHIDIVHLTDLPTGWRSLTDLRICQRLGEDWIMKGKSAMLKVPSVIIPEEKNVVINTMHPDFRSVKVREVLPFFFDPRMEGQ